MTATEGRVPFRPLTTDRPPVSQQTHSQAHEFPRKSFMRRPNIGNEVHPGTSVPRRDDRIKSVGSSFEEIRESSEEAEVEEPSPSLSNRSPHALPIELSWKRSNSFTQQHSLLSPRGARRLGAGCLQRGLSEPLLPRRKNSLDHHSGLITDRVDSLYLAPIPESVSPSSPVHQGDTTTFRQDTE